MVNPEHLNRLLKSVTAFNQWRRKNESLKIDLTHADLTGAHLEGAYLEGAKLNYADLRGAKLAGADLTGADLTHADLTGANLKRATLSGADLKRATLSGADLSGADLTEANLNGAYFTRANLRRADLPGAYLKSAKLVGADLTGANLIEADFTGANLEGANLRRADLSDADLTEAYLRCVNFSHAKLENANFDNTNLTKAVFSSKSALNNLHKPLSNQQLLSAIFEDEHEKLEKREDTHKEYIDILEIAAAGDLPEQIDESSELSIDIVKELIEAGYLKAIDASDFDGDAFIQTKITLSGREYLDKLKSQFKPEEIDLTKNKIRLFISHSSKDLEFVESLVELIRAALPLNSSQIRCTTIDGYGLPGGADTEQQLKQEVLEAEAFVGIISDHSIKSTYVIFELGARWGAGRHFIPLLSPNTDSKILTGPLANKIALNAGNQSQLHKLITDLSEELKITPDKPAVYEKYIINLLNMQNNDKLTIINAKYGIDNDWADVTNKLRDQIQNNKLSIVVSNTIFGDPAPEKIKKLVVTYKVKGIEKTTEFQEKLLAELP